MMKNNLSQRNKQLAGLINEAEEKASQIKRDAFLYLSPKSPKDEFAQCSTCSKFTGKSCLLFTKDVKVTGTMSCGLYTHGEPQTDKVGQEENVVSPKEAGLVDRQVRCENCASFDGENKCLLFEMLNKSNKKFDLDTKVDPKGCCNAQNISK